MNQNETISIRIPTDILATLKTIAHERSSAEEIVLYTDVLRQMVSKGVGEYLKRKGNK